MSGDSPQFPGFPPEAMTFLGDLKDNNDRAWFAARRAVYEGAIRQPAEAFVAVLAPELEALSGRLVTPKIFRIHRDVRFSKDKSPYNPHLHIGFMLGGDAAPGFYFGLEPARLHLGGGTFGLPGAALDAYRAAVADPDQGGALSGIALALADLGYSLGEPELQRVPAPYPGDHPRGALLRRKSLSAWRETADKRLIESSGLIAHVLGAWRDLALLNQWLATAIR